MSAPSRIRCRRTKGWRKPPGTKYVTRGGPWGNPFEVEKKGDPDEHRRVMALFRAYLAGEIPDPDGQFVAPGLVARARRELRGWHLACYCKPELACHADVLLELANAE